jgi:hypothetical protein
LVSELLREELDRECGAKTNIIVCDNGFDVGISKALTTSHDFAQTCIGCLEEHSTILTIDHSKSIHPIPAKDLTTGCDRNDWPLLLTEDGRAQHIRQVYKGKANLMYNIHQSLANTCPYLVTANHLLTLRCCIKTHWLHDIVKQCYRIDFYTYSDNELVAASISVHYRTEAAADALNAQQRCWQLYNDYSQLIPQYGSVIKLQVIQFLALPPHIQSSLKPYNIKNNQPFPSLNPVLSPESLSIEYSAQYEGNLTITSQTGHYTWIGIIVADPRHNIILADGTVTGRLQFTLQLTWASL